MIKARDSETKKPVAQASSADVSGRYTALSQKLLTGQDVLTAVASANARKRTLPGEAVAASNEAERRMLALWQEVLGIADLGVEDDYSAAGGTSLLAARLFALDCPALRRKAAADDDFGSFDGAQTRRDR